MPLSSSIIRKTLVTGALVVGATAGAAGIATAATSSSTSTSSGSSSSSSSSSGSSSSATPSGGYGTPPRAGSGAPGNPATMTHGPDETLLTGTNKQRADAAATAAEPGATIVRAETDSSGAGTYEVHMKKADGSYVTVYLNSNFKVTSTASGFGGGPAGQAGPNGSGRSGQGGGQPPANGSAPSGSSSSTSA